MNKETWRKANKYFVLTIISPIWLPFYLLNKGIDSIVDYIIWISKEPKKDNKKGSFKEDK